MGKPGTTKMVNLGPKQMKGSVYQMGPGLKMDHGAKQMSKTDKGINYMMGAATKQIGNPGLHKKNCSYGAKQMKTGLYQDRVDGKLPKNPALKQYGMDKNATKQVGKHMAMPQTEGEPEKKPTMKAAENVSFSSLPAVKAKADALSEGYRTESVKTKGNVRSTVMALETPKPKTQTVEKEQTKQQYGGTYMKRKFLPGYKSVPSASAEGAFKEKKRKGQLSSFVKLGDKANRG